MILLIACGTGLLAYLLCRGWISIARRWHIFDVPNQRSAHQRLVPRGGGAGVVAAIIAAAVTCHWLVGPLPLLSWQLLGLGAVLAVVGMADDITGLPVWVRLCLYLIIAAVCVIAVLDLAPWWLATVSVLYIVWLLNLFNFMDGTDGIAASEAAFVATAAGGLSLWLGADAAYGMLCFLVAGASAGFLFHNWPPASLFMGDTGSIALGFLLAGLSLSSGAAGGPSLVCWLILLAVFMTDASYTLGWRVVTRQPFTQAHSLHAYQRLARHWGSHRPVLWAVIGINLLWLLPLAILAAVREELALWLLPLAYLPVLLIVAKSGKLP